jgi:hypothetical protein
MRTTSDDVTGTTGRRRGGMIAAASALALTGAVAGQVVTPEFEADYVAVDLGSVPGVPTPYGGVNFLAGEPDTMLIGGSANNAAGAIYRIEVERGCDGGIVGFVGKAELFAEAPNIDGGLAYGPGGVLFYTGYPINVIGQIRPGETTPSRIISLSDLGVSSSVGTLQFVPAGFPGEGRLKILSYNGQTWYDATTEPDGAGTFDILEVELRATVGGGPEGLVFVGAASPGFDAPSALVSQFGAGRVVAFEVDEAGDAIPATERAFITGLSGAEGAVTDPQTGEFLFSTFGGGNRVVVVRGFQLQCAADVVPPGGDGAVDFDDLLAVLSSWGESCTGPDIDRSGEVDFEDVLAVISGWGPC